MVVQCASDDDDGLRPAGDPDRKGDPEPGNRKTVDGDLQRRNSAAVLLVVRGADREGEAACGLRCGRSLYRCAAAGEILAVSIRTGGVGSAVFPAGGCRNDRRTACQQAKSPSQIIQLCKLPCIFLVGK